MQTSDLKFDACAQSLESSGYALLPICVDLKSSIAKTFSTARNGLDAVSSSAGECNVPLIDSSSDSGSWTGYHRAALQNGRYNRFREGFVFSNGEMFDIDTSSENGQTHAFATHMNELFHTMHNVIANGVLGAIERRLQLPSRYFQNELGPTNKSSQWHLKRYNVDTESDSGSELLPMHTDPSLISVVILDKPGVQPGCMGLEIYQSDKSWKEVPQHGHGIAIIFVGSVLSHLIRDKSIFPAAKHRVVQWWDDADDSKRVAATLFFRPHGDAIMKPLTSRLLTSNDEPKKTYQTFIQWNAKVARNYMKKKGESNRS